MTNYNERLDEIIDQLSDSSASRGWLDCKSGSEDTHPRNDLVDIAKQDLTSLTKELVEEAKPYGKRQFRELIEDAWYKAPTAAAGFGRIEAIHNQFEQNLLKALEEV